MSLRDPKAPVECFCQAMLMAQLGDMLPERLGFMQPIRSCFPSSLAGACINTATRHVKPKAPLYSKYTVARGTTTR